MTIDATSHGSGTPAFNVSHTVGTLTNGVLIVLGWSSLTGGASLPTVTWNGVAMTNFLNATDPSFGNRLYWGFYKVAPASGTHNINVNSSNAKDTAFGISVDHVNQSTPIDVSGSNKVTPGTTVTTSITVAAANEIILGFGEDSTAAAGASISSGTTIANENPLGTNDMIYAGYRTAKTSAAGSESITATTASANLILWAIALLGDTTTFTKSASATVSVAASRLATAVRLMTFTRAVSATVTTAASRLATVTKTKVHLWTAAVSVTVSVAASRLVTVIQKLFHMDSRNTGTFTADTRSASATATIDTKSSSTLTLDNRN